jgi:hypothetical protein
MSKLFICLFHKYVITVTFVLLTCIDSTRTKFAVFFQSYDDMTCFLILCSIKVKLSLSVTKYHAMRTY